MGDTFAEFAAAVAAPVVGWLCVGIGLGCIARWILRDFGVGHSYAHTDAVGDNDRTVPDSDPHGHCLIQPCPECDPDADANRHGDRFTCGYVRDTLGAVHGGSVGGHAGGGPGGSGLPRDAVGASRRVESGSAVMS